MSYDYVDSECICTVVLLSRAFDDRLTVLWILFIGLPKEEKRPRELVVQEQLLHYLESAYPNILPTDDLAELVVTLIRYLETIYLICLLYSILLHH